MTGVKRGLKVQGFWVGVIWVMLWGGVSCSFAPVRPCTQKGQAPHDAPTPPIGVKSCRQIQDPETGHLLNHGKYYEWYENDVLATEGEYDHGKKVGRWIEYDLNGLRISDRYFSDGKEVAKP